MKKKFRKYLGIFLISVLSTSFLSSINYSGCVLANDKKILTIDQKIGMNGHIDVPRNILYAGGVVREYHNFGWSITSNKQMYFERFSWWDFDGYYKDLYEHGITILPCIQMGEQSVFNRNRNEKPVMNGDDTTDPMSYKIHSNYMYNYAARYGKTVVDESKLNLDPNDTYKSGLGYITYYEDWNEPDKTWQGPDAQFSSIELAAMLSADYDGHEGRLGDTYGIKQADPNSKLVMGGIAGGSTMVNWLNEMQEWANTNRTDKRLPLDVINYHQYTGTHSPENSSFVSDAKKIIEWRDQNNPSLEIWITEFGWDTNLGSTKHAAPNEDAQRDWIIREYLIGDRIGLDRMTVYDALNDGPSSDTTQYSTSGLATKVSEGTVKKSSWYGVNTFKNTLKGYYLKDVIREDQEMYIYKYTNGINDCYVIWSPTENNTVINDYSLNVGNYENATLTVLKDKEELGITTNLTIVDKNVKVNVSESPIFIKVSGEIREKEQEASQEKIVEKNEIPKSTIEVETPTKIGATIKSSVSTQSQKQATTKQVTNTENTVNKKTIEEVQQNEENNIIKTKVEYDSYNEEESMSSVSKKYNNNNKEDYNSFKFILLVLLAIIAFIII